MDGGKNQTRPNRWAGHPARAAIIVATLVVGLSGCKGEPQPTGDPPGTDVALVNPDLPPIQESPFLNVAGATYVGNDRCIECHAEEHENYIHTGMGQSLGDIDLSGEPPEGEVLHELSQRNYRIYHKDGQMFHQELAMVDGREQVMGDHPVRYVIGSGHHSRSYLVELEGFLYESPVTWYPAYEKWGISPGYDEPNQPGFKRAVGQKCLVCHAGQSEVIGDTVNKLKITEQWISCERCHGPGSLHVTKQLAETGDDGGEEFDNTIVNPAHLSRELSEDVCSQCHQGFPGMAFVRDRQFEDYRPGLPLRSFRLDYRYDVEGGGMTIVGHMGQMKRSTCYQMSEMTCTTCHNPHDLPPRANPVEYHKRNCLKCHMEEACSVDPAVREAERADNYCVACHMPATGTESPHLTFTHHRIGIHSPGEPVLDHEDPVLAEVVPVADLSGYSQADQDLGLGIAYYNLSRHSLSGPHGDAYRARGEALLQKAWDGGLRNGELATLLAEISVSKKKEDYEMYADYALAVEDLSPENRVGALLVKVTAHYHRKEFQQMAELMKEVTSMRRRTGDWDLLGKYLYQSGQRGEAKKAFEKSLEIDPANRPVRLMLEQFNR